MSEAKLVPDVALLRKVAALQITLIEVCDAPINGNRVLDCIPGHVAQNAVALCPELRDADASQPAPADGLVEELRTYPPYETYAETLWTRCQKAAAELERLRADNKGLAAEALACACKFVQAKERAERAEAEAAQNKADAERMRERAREESIREATHCMGYPNCDGDIEGETHSAICPAHPDNVAATRAALADKGQGHE